MKVLGSFVGSDEFILRRLHEYFLELEADAFKLIKFPDLQSMFILLRKSFILKPLHIFRTIKPTLTADFVGDFDLIKAKILCHLLGLVDVEELEDIDFCISQLNIDQGGLGLGNTSNTAQAAFVAATIDYHNQFDQCLLSLLDEDGAAVKSSKFMQEFIQFATPFLDQDHPDINHLLQLTRSKTQSVQAQLQQKLDTRFTSEINKAIADRGSTFAVFHNGLCNPHAGKWLEAMPVHAKLTMPSNNFQAALRYRMCMKPKGFVAGTRCICSHHPMLDNYGHHAASGCANGGYLVYTHDGIKRTLNSILTSAGLWTRMEERQLLDGDKRPDITIHNYHGLAQKLLIDVSVTSSIRYHNTGEAVEVRDVEAGKQADARHKQKLNQYEGMCKANGFRFQTFILESNGYMHPEAVKLIKYAAKEGNQDRRIPQETLFGYNLKLISISLQMGISNSIIRKLADTVRRGIRDRELQNDEETILNEARYMGD